VARHIGKSKVLFYIGLATICSIRHPLEVLELPPRARETIVIILELEDCFSRKFRKDFSKEKYICKTVQFRIYMQWTWRLVLDY
jgi:hypothetical protein